MNEKIFLETNLSLTAENSETKDKRRSSESKLAELLKNGTLTNKKIVEEAKKIGMKVVILCYRILSESQLEDDFIVYVEKIKGSDMRTESEMENALFSFFEKIQSESVAVGVIPPPPTADDQQGKDAKKEEPEKEAEKPAEEEDKAPQKVAAQIPPQPQAPENLPVAPTKIIEPFPKPERKNWWEVKREAEVMAIEDLDGNMETFEKHVKALGVAKKDASGHWQWTGENKKLVFLGDILGDRGMDGIEITNTIFNLADQAEKEGGQVDFLCGNHDMEFIRFLTRDADDDYAKMNANLFTNQNIGIWELVKFDDPSSELKKVDPLSSAFKKNEKQWWSKLYNKMPEILANMRSSTEGRIILENICHIKIVRTYDDTLFCHTDPTMKMISDLVKDHNIFHRVVEINTTFQENLLFALAEGRKMDTEFKNIEDIYLNTRNRLYFVETDDNLIQDLYQRFEDNLNRKEMLNRIKEWQNRNDLVGDYADDVTRIFYEFKTGIPNRKRMDRLEDDLTRRIEYFHLEYVEKVRGLGVNAIIHGHSPMDNRYHEKDNFVIASPHSYFIKGIHRDKAGISTIRKNGKIDLILKSFRDKRN